MTLQPAEKKDSIETGTITTSFTKDFTSLYKVGNVVNCSFKLVNVTLNGHASPYLATIPEKFRPKAFQFHAGLRGNGTFTQVTFYPNGTIQQDANLSNESIQVSASWIVD